MEIKTSKKNDFVIVEIIGSLDSANAEQAQQQLMELVKPKGLVIFDMKKCDFLSSAGLRVLLMIAKRLTSLEGKGAITGLSDELKDIMSMTGFDHIFSSYENLDEAISAIS